jgi:hypothetical protein
MAPFSIIGLCRETGGAGAGQEGNAQVSVEGT